MEEKRSREDWALERERQETLTLRDQRLRKNAWALVWILSLLLDPFGGVGAMIERVGEQVRPQPAPLQRPRELRGQSTEPAASPSGLADRVLEAIIADDGKDRRGANVGVAIERYSEDPALRAQTATALANKAVRLNELERSEQ